MIEQSSLTLTEPDLHPTNQMIQVRTAAGVAEYQIREISYAVLPLTQIRLHELQPQLPVTQAPEPVRQQALDAAALEDAEATARVLLHEKGADLKYAPRIIRRRGSVRIDVVVDDEQQRNELRNALAAIPHVMAYVGTPDAVSVTSNNEPKEIAAPATPLHRTEALMGDDLVRCLGSAEAANAFIAHIHNTMHAAMVPTIALEVLANRYSGHAHELLSPEARTGIDRIGRDYAASLGQYARQLNADLDPIFRHCVQPQGRSSHIPSPNAASAAADWRKSGRVAVSYFRRFDSFFNLLFTTQESPATPVSAEQAIAGLADAEMNLEQSALQAHASPPVSPPERRPPH